MTRKIFKRFFAAFLTVCTIFFACALPAFADEQEELYDVTTSGVYTDFRYLFDPPIDTSKYRTSRLSDDAADYIEIVSFYSDAVFSEWGNSASLLSGADYIYVYCPSARGTILGGSIATGSGSIALLTNDQSLPFIKFRLDSPYRDFDDQTATASIPVESISIQYRSIFDGDDSGLLRGAPTGTSYSKTYPFQDFSIDLSYKDQSGSELNKVEFNGIQVLDLDIGYTYWRSANFSPKGDGWHYQVDSIYFAIPNSIQDRLVDVELSYQQATTTPIVVTKTGQVVDGINVSEWFQSFALNPGSVFVDPFDSPSFATDVYSGNPSLLQSGDCCFNKFGLGVLGTSSSFLYDLDIIYWAFGVKNPSKISSGDLNSGELSHPSATVSAARLEEWMLNYPLEGATTTYTAANREGTGTQQVNGILFSNVQERVTKNASSIAGTTFPSYGDEHNFFQNVYEVGWPYAWSYLTGAARKDNDGNEIPIDTLKTVIHPLHSYNDITDNSDVLHFSASEEANLKTALSRANGNGETLYLVNFNVSDYYSKSFSLSKVGSSFSWDDTQFDGYVAIQDVYLDLHVLRLFFKNAQGEVYPLDVRSNGINGVAPVTPAPEKEQQNEAATKALKTWLANETRPFWERLWDILRKVITVILVLFAVVIFLRILLWILLLRRQKKQQQQNTGQDQSQRRERPRRQKLPYRERSRRPDRRRRKR